jgi:cytochrome c oxidase subunit II
MGKFFHDLLGLPPLASKQGQDVDNLIIYVHWLMIALFIGWFAYFAYTLLRFRRSRNPKADYVGVRGHFSNYLEIAVVVAEGVLLLGFAIPLWAKAVDKFPKEEESTVVHVVAQQFAWNIRYPGADAKFGKQDMHLVNDNNLFGMDMNDPSAKDDVQLQNQMHVVVNKPVIVYLTSKDVIHSFKLIAMRLTQDAIPGMRIPLHFTPTRTGRYQINCAQLCGMGHANMAAGFVIVDTQEDYDKWLAEQKPVGAGGGSSVAE